MTQIDAFGLPLTTGNEAAAQAYVRAVDLLLSYQSRAEVLANIEQALELDAGFALAHIAHARVLQISGQVPQARVAADTARAAAQHASARERWHVEVQALLIHGNPTESFALLQAEIDRYPRDAMALSVAVGAIGLFAFSGAADSREQELALLQKLEPHWGAHWWFDTYLGWAYVETGSHERGIALLDRALQAMPDNAQTVHARAHGYYETGQAREGLAFIRQWLDQHDQTSALYPHLRWHEALFALQLGEGEQAQTIYREAIAPAVSLAAPLLILMDAASFAWRSVIHGQPLSKAQMQEVAEQARLCLPKPGPAFFNWHKALALASAQDLDGLQQMREQVAALVAGGKQPPGEVMVQFCQALVDMVTGNSASAIASLQLASREASRIGGSSAQQDVIVDSLIAALLANDDQAGAREVAARRTRHRALHLDENWVRRLGSMAA